jgi:glycosyltransferase involved in cell wall biosynthesis
VRKDFPEAKFLWVGDGSHEKKAKDFVCEAGLRDSVAFLGRREDIPEILAALDVFVLSSRSEGSPAVLKEALLMEKPVVSTNVGAIPEIIKHGQNGVLVPPERPDKLAEGIIKVLRNPHSKEMGKKGSVFIKEEFGEIVLAEKTKKVYLDLLQ